MSDVIFEEEPQYQVRSTSGAVSSRPSFLVRTVLKLGLAKDEKESQRVLLIIAVLLLLATFVIFLMNTGGGNVLSQDQLNTYIENMKNVRLK